MEYSCKMCGKRLSGKPSENHTFKDCSEYLRGQLQQVQAELEGWVEKGIIFIEQGEQLQQMQIGRDRLRNALNEAIQEARSFQEKLRQAEAERDALVQEKSKDYIPVAKALEKFYEARVENHGWLVQCQSIEELFQAYNTWLGLATRKEIEDG